MQAVIHKVLEAEAAARTIVGAARTDAAKIIADARSAAQEIAVRNRDSIRRDSDQLLSQSAHDAGQRKIELLARAAKEIETQINLDATTRQHAVEAVVRCVSSR